MAIAHNYLFNDLDGFSYYGTAAMLPVIVVSITANMSKITRFIMDVQRYCLLSFVVNLAGWVAWGFYSEPTGYNIASIILYFYAILILTRTDYGCRGNSTMDRWATLFRSDACQDFIQRTKNKRST